MQVSAGRLHILFFIILFLFLSHIKKKNISKHFALSVCSLLVVSIFTVHCVTLLSSCMAHCMLGSLLSVHCAILFGLISHSFLFQSTFCAPVFKTYAINKHIIMLLMLVIGAFSFHSTRKSFMQQFLEICK